MNNLNYNCLSTKNNYLLIYFFCLSQSSQRNTKFILFHLSLSAQCFAKFFIILFSKWRTWRTLREKLSLAKYATFRSRGVSLGVLCDPLGQSLFSLFYLLSWRTLRTLRERLFQQPFTDRDNMNRFGFNRCMLLFVFCND